MEQMSVNPGSSCERLSILLANSDGSRRDRGAWCLLPVLPVADSGDPEQVGPRAHERELVFMLCTPIAYDLLHDVVHDMVDATRTRLRPMAPARSRSVAGAPIR